MGYGLTEEQLNELVTKHYGEAEAPAPTVQAPATTGGGFFGRHAQPGTIGELVTQGPNPLFQIPGVTDVPKLNPDPMPGQAPPAPAPAPGVFGPPPPPADPVVPPREPMAPTALAGGGAPGAGGQVSAMPSLDARALPSAGAGAPMPSPAKDYVGQSAPTGGASGGGKSGGVSAPKGPSLRDMLYGTFDNEKDYVAQAGEIEGAKADALAAGQGVLADAKMAESVRREQEAQAHAELFKGYQEQLDAEVQAVRMRRVDPERITGGIGNKIFAAIGGALGGLYQGLTHGQSNEFLDHVNRLVDRDIALQERELARAGDSIKARSTLLGHLQATYKDESLARAQAKNLYFESIKDQIGAYAATFDSPAIATRASQAMNGIDRQIASLKLDEQAKAAAAAAAAERFRLAQLEKEDERRRKWFEAETDRMKAGKETGAGAEHSPEARFVPLGTDPNGGATGYIAADATSARKARDQIEASKTIVYLANRAKKIRESEGTSGRLFKREGYTLGAYTPEWQTRLASIEKDLVGAIKEANKLGALDNGVERFAEPITGKLATVGSSADEKLDELLQNVEEKMRIHTQAMGGQSALKMPDGRVMLQRGVASPVNRVGSQGVDRQRP